MLKINKNSDAREELNIYDISEYEDPKRYVEGDQPEASGAANKSKWVIQFSDDKPPHFTPKIFHTLLAHLKRKEVELTDKENYIVALERLGQYKEQT